MLTVTLIKTGFDIIWDHIHINQIEEQTHKQQSRDLIDQISEQTGVPKQYILGIIYVESRRAKGERQ